MKARMVTIRIPQEVIVGAEKYAKEHSTTVDRLVTVYLQGLTEQGDPFESAPITRSLVGILSRDVEPSEYYEHARSKYGLRPG